jgi:hypothetical protein
VRPSARTWLACCLSSSLVLAPSTPARADPPSPWPLAPVDYDAPDPDRNALNYARAVANFTLSNYAVFQGSWLFGNAWSYVTRSSIEQTLGSDLQLDYDPLHTNLLFHPLQGSLDFVSARAAGLSFWESALFPALAALEWDYLAERQIYYPAGWRSKPSTNDFLTTATAGIILGEISYRLSSVLLDEASSGGERVLRELAAAIASPMRGINRLYTGEAWQSGPPPLRSHPVSVALDVGVDQLRTDKTYAPTGLIAGEISYGDLLPTNHDDTLDPFEFFELYGALNPGSSQLSGIQVYAQGLLYGSSTAPSPDEQPDRRDNDVFGFVQNFDYQGANLATYGDLSVGPANYAVWRFGARRKLRLGFDVDWTYLAATTSPFATGTNYNFSTGGAAGIDGRLELGPCGTLSLRSRNYLTQVLDGKGGQEFVGYERLAYDVHVAWHLGLGLAPILAYRRSMFEGQSVAQTSLEAQAYLRVEEGE